MTPPDPSALRVVFLGTPAFAVPSLRALAPQVTIAAVISQPDRPAGRGRKLTSPPVVEAARILGLPVMQPESLKSAAVQAEVRALTPDLLAVVAYGRIIPPVVLALPRLAGINVHPSLLPAYRGASPIQAAVADGARLTGVTIMHLADELDAGDIILQREVPIGPEETAGELEARLAEIGAALLVEAIRLIAAGTVPRTPQDHSKATYAGKVSKTDGEIAWNKPATVIVNQVRAMNPWPCAYTTWRGGTLRVWRAAAARGEPAPEMPQPGEGLPGERVPGLTVPGQVLFTGESGIAVAAGQGTVELSEVQPQGGRRMSAGEFLRGHALQAGERLGARAESDSP
jgi:methionyl-tRNA formyltransferase